MGHPTSNECHTGSSEARSDFGGGLLGRDDRIDFEVDDVAPIGDPLIEEGAVVRFHELIAAVECGGDPTRYVGEFGGGHASAIAEAAVDGRGIVISEFFDHHV